MPFYKRTIEPVYVCRNNPLLVSENILETQNQWALINYIRQVDSLSTHSSEIFTTINKNIGQLGQRATMLENRLKNISEALPTLRLPIDYLTTAEGFAPSTYVMNHKLDSVSLGLGEMPKALSDLYNSCQPMPNFEMFDAYQRDGSKTSDLYSNPKFFFLSWQETLERDMKARQNKRKKRAKTEVKDADHKIAEAPINRQREIAERHKISKQPSPDSTNITPISTSEFPPPPDSHLEDSVISQTPDHDDMNLPPPTEMSPPPQKVSLEPRAPPPAPGIPSLPSSSVPPPPPCPIKPPSSDISQPPCAPPPPPPCAPPPPPPSAPSISSSAQKAPVASKVAISKSSAEPTDLLSSIRAGKSLKKVEPVQKKEAAGFGDEVYDILAKKIAAYTMGDSDEEDGDDGDGEWD